MATAPPPSAKILNLRPTGHEDAARVAMNWLMDRHRKAWRSAFESLMDLLLPALAEQKPRVDEALMEMLDINAGEWLLARGEFYVKGETRSINAHLLGRDGPYLAPAQQSWIAQLAQRPLRLYRVTDTRPGQGLTLVDELDRSADPLVVQEVSGSHTAQPGMLLGARVMHLADHLEFSGAVYPFAALHEATVLARVRAAEGAGLLAENNQQLAELELARCWLAQWFEPAPSPDIRDAASGESMLLVTDHYRVLDPTALARALGSAADVTGDAQHGWHRDLVTGDGHSRSIAAINPGRSEDRLSIFYRAQRWADEGRPWFETLAGSAVQHLTREIVDPRSPAALEAAAGRARPLPVADGEDLSALMEQVVRRHYAKWEDEPIPFLDNQTPRQAMRTAAGLERLRGLLRTYEAGEAEMARSDRREPVSYQFLWDRLGIER